MALSGDSELLVADESLLLDFGDSHDCILTATSGDLLMDTIGIDSTD